MADLLLEVSTLASRKPLLVAVILFGLHVAVVSALRPGVTKAILSDSIQLALGILALIWSIRVARASAPFGRAFWTLIASGFAIWCVGQSLGLYYGSIRNLDTQQLWFVDVFYNVWTAPLVMCLFLDPDADSDQIDWPRILDFAQVAIVVLLVYLYFSRLAIHGGGSQSWKLALATDGLTTAGFLLRGGLTTSDATSRLFRWIGYFRLIAFLTDVYFALGFPAQLNGEWFDLLWSVPWLIPVAAAKPWNPPMQRQPGFSTSFRSKRLVLTQLLPLLFPMLVLVTAAQIARVQLEVAAAAVFLSLLISYSRLLIIQGEQRRGAERLRQQHTLMQAIIEGTTELIFVKDVAGKYLMINAAGAQVLGRSVSEVIGRYDQELLTEEVLERVRNGDRLVLESGKAQTYEDSSQVAGDTRTFLTTKAPYRDAQGTIIGVIGISLDITDRKFANEALASSEARFRTIFEDSPIGIAVINMAGEAVAINNAYRQMLGLSSDQPVSNRLFNELTFPGDREADDRRYNKLASGSIDRDRRIKRYVTQTGGMVWVDLNLTLLRGTAKEPRYVMVMAIDVTESKRLEEQLQQAQKLEAIGKLSGGVAHDFNNVLTVIKGYSSLLLDRMEPSDTRNLLERIAEAADRAAALTHQLLAFSRRQVMQPKVFKLSDLVTDLEKMLRRLIGEHIDMTTHTAPDDGMVRADRSQIEQVLMNLVVNARDAMPNGGKLTVQTQNVELDDSYARDHVGVTPGQYVLLAVSDTGSGIDAETRARIFEPFFTTKETGKGTGLGLSMVYGIVKQSGGHIWVYSEPEQGTTFKIYLPRVESEPDSVSSSQPLASTVRGSETILLVEDDHRVRELAHTVLTACGYHVLVAERPSNALSLCCQHGGPIQLLLTDVIMPECSGRELADKIVVQRPGIKILYMSGYTDAAIVHHGVLDDGTAFIQKPFTPAALTAKVREVLREQ